MLRFDIITIFPKIFNAYLKEGLIARAQKKKLLEIKIHNLRRWTSDARKTVDDRPFGGGRGMVVKVEPVYRCVSTLTKTKNKKSKIILLTPRGKKFNQEIAAEFLKLDQLILICGRYEGVDERVAKYIATDRLSVGNYVLMGGELPALIIVETVARLIPGVVGKSGELYKRVTTGGGFIEYPQYTRPSVFISATGKKWKVPQVLLSGNHKKIEEWRKKHQKIIGK